MNASLSSRIIAANATLIVGGELDAIGEYFGPSYVAHITDQVATGGHALVRRLVESYRKAFPDVQVEVEILVEAGDRVAWQRTLRATHSGAFLGFPATGRSIVWRDMVVSRLEDGLMVEDWVITDLAEQLLRARKGRDSAIRKAGGKESRK